MFRVGGSLFLPSEATYRAVGGDVRRSSFEVRRATGPRTAEAATGGGQGVGQHQDIKAIKSTNEEIKCPDVVST